MKILQVVSGLGGGGVSSLLYTYYSSLDDYIDTDFIVHVPHTGLFEPYFIEHGSKVFHVVPVSENWFKHLVQINKVLRSNHYDIIHVHQDVLGWPNLLLAMLNGVKIRIAHSHLAYRKPKPLKRKIYTFLTKLFSTDLWACGIEAGINAWGNSEFYVMKNASVIEKFAFDQNKRKIKRREFGVGNELLLGMIGRFDMQKNHQFAVKIVKHLKETGKDFKILFIGDGKGMENIRQEVRANDCEAQVIFAGLRSDVSDCLNAIDMVIMPSLYEGLPVVMIEAQANGLPILVSDRVTRECAVLDNIVYLPIDDSRLWSEFICKHSVDRVSFAEANQKLTDAGYNIHVQARELFEKYQGLINQK